MPVNNIIIRDAVVDDVPELTMLMNELGYPTTKAEMQARFERILPHPDYKTIVAVAGGQVAGIAGLFRGLYYEKNGMYMRVLAFVVKQSNRRQGIGELLMQASETWAAEQGLDTSLISSGNRDERTAAHAFYQKMGYAIKSSGFIKHL